MAPATLRSTLTKGSEQDACFLELNGVFWVRTVTMHAGPPASNGAVSIRASSLHGPTVENWHKRNNWLRIAYFDEYEWTILAFTPLMCRDPDHKDKDGPRLHQGAGSPE